MAEFTSAINRGLGLYVNKEGYQVLRQNAFAATVDGEVVARAWNKEFYRLKGKIYHEHTTRALVKESLHGLGWSPKDFDDSVPENRNTHPALRRTTSGILLAQAASAKKALPPGELSKQQHLFTYRAGGCRLQSVQLAGSFDKWQIRHPLAFDHAKASWHVTLQLPRGRFYYKLVLDGTTWVHSADHPTERDEGGNVNNLVEIR